MHTVDRLRIAERLSAQRPESLPPLAVCIQVQIGDESTKSGVAPAGLAALAGEVARLPRLRCAASCACRRRNRSRHASAAGSRSCGLLEGLNAAGHGLDSLSMGMSGDFAAAIAEGATHLRIGTAVFGERV